MKKYLWLFLLAAGLQTSWGFALLGPETPNNGADAWQSAVYGYHLAYANASLPGGPNYLGDIGGPRDISQEYRRNVPVLYYSYDPTFLGFFGSNGVVAVDSAAAIMNSFTNVDTVNLAQYPLDSQNYNYEAAALFLTDLKSTTLHLLVEQMGLAQPERFTWTIHDRALPPGGKCPIDEEYLVVQRNYDITNTPLNMVQSTAYVNNVLYTYEILEACTGGDPLAIAEPFAVDPLADQYTAVADSPADTFGGLQIGGFYNNLTRDDVAGLNYLLSTNNINVEKAAAGSLLFTVITNNFQNTQNPLQTLFPTNSSLPSGFGTYNLGSLLSSAVTNNPALLPVLFPGVVVASSQNYYVLITNQTVSSAFVPPKIGSPFGTPPVLVLVTNYTPALQQQFVTTFANVITNYYSSNSTAILETIKTGPIIGAPAGTIGTTTNYQTVKLNVPTGSFYVVPNFGTNLCPAGILYTGLTTVFYTTNLITATFTNVVTTNATVFTYQQSLITWYTNYTYVAYSITCGQTAAAVGEYQGIGHVQFVRRDFDALLQQNVFPPVDSGYSMVAYTTASGYVTQHFDREVTGPDILFAASDDGQVNTFNGTVTRSTPNWDESQLVAGGEAGPGVINSSSTLTYNSIGVSVYNGLSSLYFPFFNPILPDENTGVPSVGWASFDVSTNDPVVYPNGTSLANLASQVLIQITPTGLPDATYGVPYSQTFSVVAPRLTPPFTWSALNLPPGLTMSAAGVLSGTPTDPTGVNGVLTYDITIILTDSLSNSVQWVYPMTTQ